MGFNLLWDKLIKTGPNKIVEKLEKKLKKLGVIGSVKLHLTDSWRIFSI